MVDKRILIDLVRERVPLWNQREKQYHNRDLRTKLWEEVGKELKIEGDEARKHWELLRDMFRRKIKESKGVSGSAAKPKWTYFDALSFLAPMIKSRVTSGNLPVSERTSSQHSEEHDQLFDENYISSIESIDEINVSQPSGEGINPQGGRYQRQGLKRKQGPSIQAEALELERRKVNLVEARFATPQQNTALEDEDLSFFKSLLPSMKKLSDIRRIKLRSTILNCVIAELEEAQENNRSCTSPPGASRYLSGSAYDANPSPSETSSWPSPNSS